MALMFFLTNFGLRQMSFWLQVWTFVCTTFLCFSWLLLSIFVLFNNWHQRVNLQKLTPKERNAVCWSHCVCCHAMSKSKSEKIEFGQSTVCAALLCPNPNPKKLGNQLVPLCVLPCVLLAVATNYTFLPSAPTQAEKPIARSPDSAL